MNGVVFEDSDCQRGGRFAAHFDRAAGARDAGLVVGAEVESRFVLVLSRRTEVTLHLRNRVVVRDGTGHDNCV